MKTYHIVTIGCQMSKSDSERIAGFLEKHGLVLAKNRADADLVILTTCGVRQSAEDRIYGLAPRIKKDNPSTTLVLTGCLSERSDVKKRLKNIVDIWLPIGELANFTQRISRNAYRATPEKKTIDNCNYLSETPKYSSNILAFVPIGNGCNNYCSYCVVPYARGREQYRPAGEILHEAEELVKNGYKDINLIAQNVNSFIDGGRRTADGSNYNFANLLHDINNIPGEFWIRFATSHPKDMSGELIDTIVDCSKVCEHIHLPVQAGDNEILKKMNRQYTVGQYIELINKIRDKIPGAAITTDIIVGFPGETMAHFGHTVELVKEVKFDQIYIARYSPRPGTAAAKLTDDVPKAEKKRREDELTKILKKTALLNNKKYIGKTVGVLIEGKNKNGHYIGKTRSDKNVEIRTTKHEISIGNFVQVKIKTAQEFGLAGKLV